MARELAIKAVDLTKCFGQRLSVDRLNLEIGQGEFYALLGDNGAGKTTTLNMFTTLLKPNEGSFYICGVDGVTQTEKTKGLFGVVSQDIAAYSELTAYENLNFIASLHKLPKEKAQKRIHELLTQFDLADRVHDHVHTFSGGMLRKLLIASALLHEPAVLFMDEPTVGLDPGARRQLWGILHDLHQKGITIFLTTHYLEEAEILADRIGIIRHGKLVTEGTVEQLKGKMQLVSGIEVRLNSHFTSEEADKIIARGQSKLNMSLSYDTLHNTLTFMPVKKVGEESELVKYLQKVLDWLFEENITFVKFRTNDPSLEEVFLAICDGDRAQ